MMLLSLDYTRRVLSQDCILGRVQTLCEREKDSTRPIVAEPRTEQIK